MKVAVRFESESGYCAMVGMNNLFIIEDDRIKTMQGIAKRVDDLITLYHPYRLNQYYRVFTWDDKFLFQGKNGTIQRYSLPKEV